MLSSSIGESGLNEVKWLLEGKDGVDNTYCNSGKQIGSSIGVNPLTLDIFPAFFSALDKPDMDARPPVEYALLPPTPMLYAFGMVPPPEAKAS